MNTEIINAGIGGNNTRQILDRLESDCLAYSPSLVVLLAGTNDTLNSHNLVPLEETNRNLAEIATQIKEAGARLALCTMLPFYEPSLLARHGGAEAYGALSHTRRYELAQNAIRALANNNDLPLVDLHTLFTGLGEPHNGASSLLRNGANCGIDDGIHPTSEGYRFIAVAVWQALVAHELPLERIVCLGDSITRGVHVQGDGTAEGETYPAVLAQLLRVQP